MQRITTTLMMAGIAFAFSNVSTEGQQQCTPHCTAPTYCEEQPKPLGTCCCPFPEQAYPGTGTDPYHILDGYALTPEQEASFVVDNQKSPFWDEWEKNPGKFDIVELLPSAPGNAWERSERGFNDDADASMEVRAAWGEKGLYLYLLVRDNQFVNSGVTCIYDPISEENWCPDDPRSLVWANDAIDMYIDGFSTDYHHPSIADEIFHNKTIDRKTRTMMQIQCQFGATNPPETFSLNKIGDNGQFQMDRNVMIQTLPQTHDGMMLDFVTITGNLRAQEWFIPWGQVGKNGIQKPTPGTMTAKIAFACGYNDADGSATSFDALRWRNAADPTKRVQDWSTGSGAYVPTEAWGDIRFVSSQLPIVNRLKAYPKAIRNVQSVEYYDLLGKTVAKFDLSQIAAKEVSLNTGASMLLERITTKSGTVHTQSIMVPQSGIVSRSF